jgi:DNA-binding CsgD family transcriptional regulator
MNTNTTELNHLRPERLLANVVILHEASKSEGLLSEIPSHLAASLGASAVSMAVITLAPGGSEQDREVHTTGAGREGEVAASDWVADLLAHRATNRSTSLAHFRVARFCPTGRAQLLYDLDAEHAVAFDLYLPEGAGAPTASARAWLLALVRHIARNLRTRFDRPSAESLKASLLKDLNDTEWQVLLWLDSDESEKQIAAALSLSVHTLHSYIKSIYRKLKVKSRLSALAVLHHAERRALVEELRSPATRIELEPEEISSPACHAGAVSVCSN